MNKKIWVAVGIVITLIVATYYSYKSMVVKPGINQVEPGRRSRDDGKSNFDKVERKTRNR